MVHHHNRRRRCGATLVEAALVYPTLMLLILGIIVVGLGVLRYNQVASLAREGARYASVRGARYAAETGNSAATTGTISAHVKGQATGLNPNSVTVTTTWTTSNSLTRTSGSATIKNTVSVTVTYPWIPEVYFGGVTLSSTAVKTMAY